MIRARSIWFAQLALLTVNFSAADQPAPHDDSPAARRDRGGASHPIHSTHAESAPTVEDSGPLPADPFLRCLYDAVRESQFAALSRKLPLGGDGNISFSMLADQTKPTPAERRTIAEWFDRQTQCWKNSEQYHRQNWPPEIFQISLETLSSMQGIGLDLYNGKLTYGAANRRGQQLQNDVDAKLVPIIKQYQAELAQQRTQAEQKAERARQIAAQHAQAAEAQAREEQRYANARAAQEEELRLRRQQLILNYMRSMQVQLPAPAPTYNTNCFTSGNYTNCTTR